MDRRPGPPGPGDRDGERSKGVAAGVAAPGYLELAEVFLKISLGGFGGPNVHLALMLDEVVERRRWITREHFLQLVAVTNLLPGPNSSEVAIHLGYTQRGWPGALVTGLSFLMPTFVMVVLFSWLYFTFGTLPAVEPLFWGLKPVILALILWAGWRLGRTAVTGWPLLVLAVLGAVVTFAAGRWAVAAMAVGGAVTWLWYRVTGARAGAPDEPPASRSQSEAGPAAAARQGGSEAPSGGAMDGDGGESHDSGEDGGSSPTRRSLLLPLPLVAAAGLGTVSTVFWLHLGIGAVLFGGGYVLVALLEPFAVGRYGWLTASQFLDGIALTQAVPGPISTLSAFVGYGAAGFPGAVAGTAGIYLPAFVAVLLVAPHLDRLRKLQGVRAILDGVGAVVAGAILGVGLTLAPEAIPGVWAGALFGAAFLGAASGRVPALGLVAGGLAAGAVRLMVL